MDNKKELKRNELNPDELENVSGGSWASDEERNKADEYLCSLYKKYGASKSEIEIFDKAMNIFCNMEGDRTYTHTADEFIERVRNELHIEV